jgi:hypothetical protein
MKISKENWITIGISSAVIIGLGALVYFQVKKKKEAAAGSDNPTGANGNVLDFQQWMTRMQTGVDVAKITNKSAEEIKAIYEADVKKASTTGNSFKIDYISPQNVNNKVISTDIIEVRLGLDAFSDISIAKNVILDTPNYKGTYTIDRIDKANNNSGGWIFIKTKFVDTGVKTPGGVPIDNTLGTIKRA